MILPAVAESLLEEAMLSSICGSRRGESVTCIATTVPLESQGVDGLPTLGIAMREHGPCVDPGNETSARVS
jgi:hypothetical protein